jgi:hypothetical protein
MLRPLRRRSRVQMNNASDPDESPGDPPKPIKPLIPKRGAFPAPKSEIEKATPYIPDLGEEPYIPDEEPHIPDLGEEEDFPAGEPDRPTDIEGEKES